MPLIHISTIYSIMWFFASLPSLLMVCCLQCYRYYSRQPGKVCVFGDLNVTLQATFMFGAKMKIRTFALSQASQIIVVCGGFIFFNCIYIMCRNVCNTTLSSIDTFSYSEFNPCFSYPHVTS